MHDRQEQQQTNNQNEMLQRRLSLIVQQMGSNDPQIREFALDSLDKMVHYEIHDQKSDIIEQSTPMEREDSHGNNLRRQDADVLYKIRLLQKEKEQKVKRRKPFLLF